MKNDPSYWFIVTMLLMLSGFIVFFVGFFIAFGEINSLQHEQLQNVDMQNKILNLVQQCINLVTKK